MYRKETTEKPHGGMDNRAGDFSLSAYCFTLLHTNSAYFNQPKALPISERRITTMFKVPEWQMTAEEYTEVC